MINNLTFSIESIYSRQDKTRQDTTRQDKTRQDKTRQDKTRYSCVILCAPVKFAEEIEYISDG